jgi:putative ubiquitin-RnfH superfamily antitoxin RatB of RatAB toxin-antitoxin module
MAYRIAIQIMLTEEQKETIKQRALDAGLTMSEYIRQSAIDHAIVPEVNPYKAVIRTKTVYSQRTLGEVAIERQLMKIGNNLNQLTRAVNTTKKSGGVIDLVKVSSYLYSIKEEVSNVLKSLR